MKIQSEAEVAIGALTNRIFEESNEGEGEGDDDEEDE